MKNILLVLFHSIKNNPSGRSTVKGFSIAHEYAIFAFASDNGSIGMIPRTDDQLSQYGEEDKTVKFQWRNFMRSGGANDFRSARPKLHYPLIVMGEKIRIPLLEWNKNEISWELRETLNKNEEIFLPVNNGVKYTWRLGIDSLNMRINNLRIRTSISGKKIIEIKFHLDESGVLPKTVWDDKTVNAAAYGTTLIRNILGVAQAFSFPKSIYAVEKSLRICGVNDYHSLTLDYFAGSGTTGHAVINLNREDGGNRKYILVEMGNYFETVLKPRIQKVIYSKDWKDGKPVSREGSSHMFKYIRLESYEDTLNNLEVKRTEAQQSLLEQSASFRESYMLSYMLDVESRGSLLNVKAFEDPFNYKLNISTGSVGETKPVAVDLVETFNYLIGLTVKHIDNIRGIKVVEGTNPKGQKVLVLWRKASEMDNDKLDAWFKKQKYNTKDMEYDLIYVNGDNNLENLRREDMTWKVRLIEEKFHSLMFDVQDV